MRHRRILLSLLATLALWPGAYSRAAVSGQLKSSTDDYPYHLGEPTADLIPYLSLELNDKIKLSKSWRLQARAFGIGNLESKSSPEQLYGDLPEAFLEYRVSSWKLRAGMDTLNWGVVDISSPSDVVNTSVLFHPLRTFKRGAPMLEAQWAGDVFGLHAIYIPRQQRPLLPSVDSRWLPRRFLMNIEEAHTRVLLPPFFEYAYDAPQTLDHALDNNAGVKLSAHLDGWDFQLTHFEGAAPSPKALPTVTINTSINSSDAYAESPIHLAPVTYRVRTTGAGAVWAREKWIFRAETAYQNTISRDPLLQLQPWSWSSVVAAETNLNVGTSTMTWLAQIYYTKNPQAPDNLISSSYRLFDHIALVGTRWAWSDRLTMTGSVMLDTENQGLFVMAGFTRKLSDALAWSLGWRDFSGGSDGLIKTYEHNDHASMDLIYYF